MAICKFFQQGSCRFGSDCRNEHFDIRQIIKADVEAAINGKQWPFSSYGPFKDKPSIPSFIDDQSFEEIRFLCYDSKQKNYFERFHQQFNKEALEATAKLKSLLLLTPGVIEAVVKVYDTPAPNDSATLAAATKNKNPFSAAGDSAATVGSIFAKPVQQTAPIFGGVGGGFGSTTAALPANSGGSIFGGAAVNQGQSGQGIFGGNTGFGANRPQGGSFFGGNSIFGGGSAASATTAPQASIFAQAQQPQLQPAAAAGRPFSLPNAFGASQAATTTTTSIFGQQSEQQQQQQSAGGGGIFGQTQPAQQQMQPFGMGMGGGGLFASAAAAQQTPNLFSQNAMQTQQQQQQQSVQIAPTANIFAQAMQQQPPPMQMEAPATPTVFQQNQPPQSQQQPQAPTITGLSVSAVYSQMSDLTADEIAAFQAETFQVGKIPFSPPAREFLG